MQDLITLLLSEHIPARPFDLCHPFDIKISHYTFNFIKKIDLLRRECALHFRSIKRNSLQLMWSYGTDIMCFINKGIINGRHCGDSSNAKDC